LINPPPSPFVVKDGFVSAFKFMSKKDNLSSIFKLNNNGFWDSCWIVFFVNAVVSTLASYGIKANLDGDIQSGILPRLLLITVIDICLFSILVNTIFEKIGKGEFFYKFIIPFNWIQSFQAILMLSFAILGLILPPSIFVFFWDWCCNMGNFLSLEDWQRRGRFIWVGSNRYDFFISCYRSKFRYVF
jgi:hypothetical protein